MLGRKAKMDRTTKPKARTPPRVAAPPKTAAVTLTIEEGSSTTYEGAMREVRQGIKLAELGIGTLRWKSAITGGLVIEVPEEEGFPKTLIASRQRWPRSWWGGAESRWPGHQESGVTLNGLGHPGLPPGGRGGGCCRR